MRVIANAKIASPKDTTCSGFTFGTNAFVDIIPSGASVVIAIIKKYNPQRKRGKEVVKKK